MLKDTVLRVTEDEQKALEKLFYTKSEQEIKNCITSLKEWISKQPHLPQNEDEFMLMRMLALNKFSVERTKSKLEIYYSGRHFIPEYFTNNYPLHPNIQNFYETCFHVPLPFLTKNLERITVTALRKECLANDFNPEDFNRLLFTTIETRIKNDACLGEINIFDFSLLNLSTATKISPSKLQNLTNFLMGAYSDTIKSLHYLNVPSFAQALIAIGKSFLKTKIADRVHVHKDLNSLHKHIDPELLPKDLGGNLRSLNELQGDWKQFLESQNDWIIERSNMKSNEKLRIGVPVSSEMFGMQGSFRQLVID